MKNLFDDEEIVTGKTSNLPLNMNPQLLDKLDGLPLENTYQNELEVNRDVGPYRPEEVKQTPGWGETVKLGLKKDSSLYSIATNQSDLNPLNDFTHDGYNAASDDSNFIGVLPKYHGNIAAAKSPNDAYFRKLDALQKQQDDEYFESGATTAKITAGFITGLEFAWIPLGQAAKYASVTKTAYEAMLAATPGLAIGSMLHEGTIQANTLGGNIHDTMVDAFVDTLGGLAFMGAGAGLGKGFDALKLFKAREYLKLNYDGIAADLKVNDKGEVIGYQASGLTNEAISAKKWAAAQIYLDSTFDKSGLFAVPYLGGGIDYAVKKANPIYRGITSRFPTMRGFTDRTASHSMVTAGNKKGIPKPDDFETEMGIVQAQNKVYYYTMQALLDRRNGINSTSDIARLGERSVKKFTDEGYTSAEAFGKEIKGVIQTGVAHENSSVNEAATMTRETLDETWELLRKTYNLPKEWMPPPTADGYFPRVYEQSIMVERPDQWQKMWVGWWKGADKQIITHMQPIENLKETIKASKLAHAAEPSPNSAKLIRDQTRQLRKMKEDLADKIKSDKTLFLHGDDQAALSGKEARQLRTLLKPMNKLKKDLKLSQAKAEKLSQQKFFTENRVHTATTPEAVAKLQEDIKRIETDLIAQKAEVQEFKYKLDIEEGKLQDKAREGKISPRIYDREPGTSLVKFKKPSNLMKFRDVFLSEKHMADEADAYHSTILNQTPEDTMAQVLGHYVGGASKEQHAMKRKLMIPDSLLEKNNFLSSNLPLIVANYRNSLHRKIALKTVFQDVTLHGGIDPITESLTKDFKEQRDAIISNEKLTEKQRAKQLKTLQKDFNDAKEDMQLSYARMMGKTNGGKKLNSFIRFMRLWTVATRLGSVPLTMTTDLSANIYKHGFWPSIRDGLVPALENLAERIKLGDRASHMQNAADAHLALETVLAANNDRDWGGIAMEHVPLSGALGNAMEYAAHVSGNIAGTNQMTNALQRMAAQEIQAKVMRYMVAHSKGELKPRDLEKLLIYGLNPTQWGERFLKQYKVHGHSGTIKGSHQSNYWKWDDAEASNKMAKTIYRGVQDTIIKKGMMDAPFFFDDPVWGTLVFFHGWSTAALTRYLVPLMQRPDAEHLTGLVWMLAAGAMVAPLRRLSKGEPMIDEDSNMFRDALTDSGVLTPIMGLVEDANILTNHTVLGSSNDRWKNRGFAGTVGGPVVGMGEDITRVLGMVASGRINETDVKKAGALVPGMQPWYLRGLKNHMLEGLGLPKTASEYENSSSNAYR